MQPTRKVRALVRELREAAEEARERATKAQHVTQSHIRDSEALIRKVRKELDARRAR
jgi:hypothetical protein